MGYLRRINNAFDNVPTLNLYPNSRIVIISDCHRGVGSANDNFLKNQNEYFSALEYYYNNGFTYVELGDGDELWENRNLNQIKEIHGNVFWLLSLFYKRSGLYMIYGNHDMVKRRKNYASQTFSNYFCTSTQCYEPLFPNIKFYSGLILNDVRTNQNIYLTHGHQAELLNSTFWRLSRFLVRYFWSPLERFGVLDPTSAAKNNRVKSNTERRLRHWASKNNSLLITGHTHRPILEDDILINSGSCVHPRCITCIEIVNRKVFLVKWTTDTRPDRTLFITRKVLSGPISLDSLYSL